MSMERYVEPDARERALDWLARIEREEGVRILLAIESGSRAWGFPSPDSDYDVRFIYAHPRDWYLSILPGRDVIERPIEGDMDVNGWDMKKALGLMCRANATPFEWIASPIIYRSEPAAVQRLRRFAARLSGRPGLRQHYLSLGRRQLELASEHAGMVKLKRYFYALRPALALAWLQRRPGDPLPMALHDLMGGLDLPADFRSAVADLVEKKRRTRELGLGPRVPALDTFIEVAFATAASSPDEKSEAPPMEEADALFREILALGA